MTSHAVEGACAFAWRNYLLVHKGVNENDDRRTALDRYVNGLYDAGERRVDILQVAAVIYLKKLDELGEDRQARLAADETLARTKPDIQRSRSPIHAQNHSIGWTFHTAWASSGSRPLIRSPHRQSVKSHD